MLTRIFPSKFMNPLIPNESLISININIHYYFSASVNSPSQYIYIYISVRTIFKSINFSNFRKRKFLRREIKNIYSSVCYTLQDARISPQNSEPRPINLSILFLGWLKFGIRTIWMIKVSDNLRPMTFTAKNLELSPVCKKPVSALYTHTHTHTVSIS